MKEDVIALTENNIPITYETMKEPMALGDIFAQSGMFPDIKSKAQAAVKIIAGRELGITPIESMTNINIFCSRLALSANLIAALVKKNSKYDYSVEVLTEKECSIKFYKLSRGESTLPEEKIILGVSTFTSLDAARAGLANKDNWKNYPRNMLFARAMANGVRWFCPDAVLGYAVEEMEDIQVTPQLSTVEVTAQGDVKNG